MTLVVEHYAAEQSVQREDEERHRTHDREVAHHRQDDPGDEDERERRVDERKEEVASDGMRVELELPEEPKPVLAQALDHPARPASPLARERAPGRWSLGEGDGSRLEHASAPLNQHLPGEDDVLADAVRPATGE